VAAAAAAGAEAGPAREPRRAGVWSRREPRPRTASAADDATVTPQPAAGAHAATPAVSVAAAGRWSPSRRGGATVVKSGGGRPAAPPAAPPKHAATAATGCRGRRPAADAHRQPCGGTAGAANDARASTQGGEPRPRRGTAALGRGGSAADVATAIADGPSAALCGGRRGSPLWATNRLWAPARSAAAANGGPQRRVHKFDGRGTADGQSLRPLPCAERSQPGWDTHAIFGCVRPHIRG